MSCALSWQKHAQSELSFNCFVARASSFVQHACTSLSGIDADCPPSDRRYSPNADVYGRRTALIQARAIRRQLESRRSARTSDQRRRCMGPSVSLFCCRRRTHQDRGRQAQPGGLLCNRPALRFCPIAVRGLSAVQSDSICVENPSSPAYNTITSGNAIGLPVGTQNMGAITLYRRGLMVDYPTDAAHRAGSCILIHVQSKSAGE